MIFTEGFVGQEIYNALISQVFWVVILLIPIRLLWSLAKKHLIVQGG
jgi:ABC-2 type transport system permease protein